MHAGRPVTASVGVRPWHTVDAPPPADQHALLHTLSIWLLAVSLSVAAGALWMRDRLPQPVRIVSSLQREPVQQPLRKAAFEVTVGDVRYLVQPLFDYEIQGPRRQPSRYVRLVGHRAP